MQAGYATEETARSLQPSVSIVITAYNQSHFLPDAIESALGQSIPPGEVIVVDDGSMDEPDAIVRRYPEVRLIRQRNQGCPAARNTGWRAAKGNYVVFLDADDRLLPDALRTNLQRFAAQPECAFVYGDYYFIDVTGRHRSLSPPRTTDDDAYEFLLKGNRITMQATVMYRRDRVEEVGGFDERIWGAEDWDLLLRLAFRYPVASGPDRIGEYRRHDGGISSRNIPLMLGAALTVLRRQAQNVKHNAARQHALMIGLRDCKSYYVRAQLDQAVMRARLSGPSEIPWHATIKVFALAPVTFARIFCRSILKIPLSWMARA